jgi:acyl-CoA reductase-like NAD-dependent aldehyde dehydrogenase
MSNRYQNHPKVQAYWQNSSVAARIKVLTQARKLIANHVDELAATVMLPGRRSAADTIVAEIIPLLSAIRFLEREAASILKPRRVGRRGRPLWLLGVTSQIRRDPFGTVLVIAPFNYPLLLAGVQAFQALVAGNAVQIKPAPGHSAPLRMLAAYLDRAGLPDGLFTILDESVQAAQEAIASKVDLIVFTGSVAAGKAVLTQAAQTLTPCIVELSGNDAVFVLDGADAAVVVRALAYGICLNGGATCIAPRRVFAGAALIKDLSEGLAQTLKNRPAYPVSQATLDRLATLLNQARQAGATIIGGDVSDGAMKPAVIVAPPPGSGLLCEDVFAPIVSLVPVIDMGQALALYKSSPFALGASVFGPARAAEDFAARIDAGVVVVNDLIAPTADPRLPFEARRGSGFGATRGREGLLAMTQSRAIAIRRNRLYPHYRPLQAEDAGIFSAYAGFNSRPSLADLPAKLIYLVKQLAAFRHRLVKRL